MKSPLLNILVTNAISAAMAEPMFGHSTTTPTTPYEGFHFPNVIPCNKPGPQSHEEIESTLAKATEKRARKLSQASGKRGIALKEKLDDKGKL